MNSQQLEILRTLDVEPIEENLFRGQNANSEHVFGGQVLAQALTSGFHTVRPEHELHSLHGYFLRAGDWTRPILYEVDRIRDGRSFSTRRVVAIQKGRAIFNLSSSWQRREEGPEHTVPMPDVPPPEALRDDRAVFADLAHEDPTLARIAFRFEAIDSRHAELISRGDQRPHPPFKHTWLRVRDRLEDSPEIHLGMLAYMSDLDFMSTSLLPHGRPPEQGAMQAASLDHALWFHRPFRADEWLLFVKESPNAGGGRGFVRGHFFNQQRELVATAAQECLIRLRDG
ncbi:MAG: acyl-CoA thioesterase II [Pseudomonadota bacterium]